MVWGVLRDTADKKERAEQAVLQAARKKGKLEKYGVVDLAAELKKFEEEVSGEKKKSTSDKAVKDTVLETVILERAAHKAPATNGYVTKPAGIHGYGINKGDYSMKENNKKDKRRKKERKMHKGGKRKEKGMQKRQQLDVAILAMNDPLYEPMGHESGRKETPLQTGGRNARHRTSNRPEESSLQRGIRHHTGSRHGGKANGREMKRSRGDRRKTKRVSGGRASGYGRKQSHPKRNSGKHSSQPKESQVKHSVKDKKPSLAVSDHTNGSSHAQGSPEEEEGSHSEGSLGHVSADRNNYDVDEREKEDKEMSVEEGEEEEEKEEEEVGEEEEEGEEEDDDEEEEEEEEEEDEEEEEEEEEEEGRRANLLW